MGGAAGDDDAVDEDARDSDLSRGQKVAGRDPLDLDDHDPARVLRRLRDRERVQRGRLALHRHVAQLVGGGAPQKRHVDRAPRIEQEVFAVELDDPHHLLLRRHVHTTAVHTRVDEGAEPDPREEAGPPGGRLAVEMGQHPEWEAVGLDPPVERERAERRDEPPVCPDRALDQPLVREVVEPAGAAVALSPGEHERQVPRALGFVEALRKRQDELLGNGDPDESTDRHRVTIEDQPRGRFGRDDLRASPSGHGVTISNPRTHVS
jgi:hypothetical protein